MDSADFSICAAGIAVPAAASACTVGTDVDTFRTAAGRPLVRISLDQQGLFQKLFEQSLIDAVTMRNSVFRQVYVFGTRFYLQAMGPANRR